MSSNIRDLLTSFSPALDYLAISSGDGRIKIWDTVKGQIQTEFSNITSTGETNVITKAEKGHLAVDYTCMKWLSLDKKKKRKLVTSLLVLGTGGGDVLALDVAGGNLKWRVNDCHPGGVSSVSFSTNASCIYTAGSDGMICEIEPHTGNLIGKFKASTKAISRICVSSDGKMLASAASQLKTINCSNHKKIQRFSGHPGAVRCMSFSEDGKFILSSAVGERYVAIWTTDGGKKQSASCVLAMEHPAVFLDSWSIDNGNADESGLCVLAISETGVCYFWYGQNIDGLRNAKATKVLLTVEASVIKTHLPTIFAAKLQSITKPGSMHAFVASGSLVKPTFQKIVVHPGSDMVLDISQDGALLPMDQSATKSKKGKNLQSKVTTLDRAYAEDALLPISKLADFHDKKNQKDKINIGSDEEMADLVDNQSQATSAEGKDDVEMEPATLSMEDRLRSFGILGKIDNIAPNALLSKGINLEANMPLRKLRNVVLSMEPTDAYQSLETLVALWQKRTYNGKVILPWIYSILVNHGKYIVTMEPKNNKMVVQNLQKIIQARGVARTQLLQLSGRLQLVTAQVNKATQNKPQILANDHLTDETDDENENVDDVLYGEEDNESELSSDDEK